MNLLEKLMYLRGLSAEYYSYSGERTAIPWEDRLQLLREMGDDPEDEDAVKQAIYELDAQPWQSWLQSLHIISKDGCEYVDIRLHPDQTDQCFRWTISTETGEVFQNQFVPTELEEVGDYYIEQTRYSARRLILDNLPSGYHQIVLESDQGQQLASLIVAPDGCFKGELERKRVWGVNCQLYALRSERNWGIGDFTDLSELIEYCAKAGMDLISLNPMHAPYTAEMEFASPYSPSDRRFLNPLYLDPEQIPEFGDYLVSDVQAQAELRRKLSDLRALNLVDYEAVAKIKYAALDCLYRTFVARHIKPSSQRAVDFQNFVEMKGQALAAFTQFESQHCGLDIRSGNDPQFHQYLQWMAEHQVSECQQLAKRVGMHLGLMKDLAVGAVKNGAEVQGNRDLFCTNSTIGAPPDPLAEHGQNWDLPALDPVALKASNYQIFIDLLRANMAACGGLRIDHILGFLRLWWCHPEINNGAYVCYPMNDLMAILCLESQRNQCLIVGEDMGTVPDELRAAMSLKSIYSNKVFYFEKENEHAFKQPHQHQIDALLMITNHDVSTLAGWWEQTDLKIRQQIGLSNSDEERRRSRAQRQQEKYALLNWLQSQQMLPENWEDASLDKSFDFDICAAILISSARSQSRMMLFQLDDLQLLKRPINIPGTHRQYPNWRRKQKRTTKALFTDRKIQALFSSIHQERVQ